MKTPWKLHLQSYGKTVEMKTFWSTGTGKSTMKFSVTVKCISYLHRTTELTEASAKCALFNSKSQLIKKSLGSQCFSLMSFFYSHTSLSFTTDNYSHCCPLFWS